MWGARCRARRFPRRTRLPAGDFGLYHRSARNLRPLQKKVHDFLTVGAITHPCRRLLLPVSRWARTTTATCRPSTHKKKELFLKRSGRFALRPYRPARARAMFCSTFPSSATRAILRSARILAHYVGVGAVPGSSFFREPVNNLIHTILPRRTGDAARCLQPSGRS